LLKYQAAFITLSAGALSGFNTTGSTA